MKLMTLNIWGGSVKEKLLPFIKSHHEVDIFCLQEVYHKAQEKISTEEKEYALNIFQELAESLPDHQGFFRPVVANSYGIGMFVKRGIHVLGEGEVTIHENPNYPGRGPAHSRNLQWLECLHGQKNYSIVNVHGLWNGKGKTDTPERIAQSERIANFMKKVTVPKIVCGDFNLRPDTKSLKIVEEGMNNLIRLHNIQSTRTSLYPKEEKFADYVLTSPEIQVHAFIVLDAEVSDHSPLLLEFS